jgi:hypothetical protein
MKIEKHQEGSMEWTQPTLIKAILKDFRLIGHNKKNMATARTIPENSTVTLKSH